LSTPSSHQVPSPQVAHVQAHAAGHATDGEIVGHEEVVVAAHLDQVAAEYLADASPSPEAASCGRRSGVKEQEGSAAVR